MKYFPISEGQLYIILGIVLVIIGFAIMLWIGIETYIKIRKKEEPDNS